MVEVKCRIEVTQVKGNVTVLSPEEACESNITMGDSTEVILQCRRVTRELVSSLTPFCSEGGVAYVPWLAANADEVDAGEGMINHVPASIMSLDYSPRP